MYTTSNKVSIFTCVKVWKADPYFTLDLDISVPKTFLGGVVPELQLYLNSKI